MLVIKNFTEAEPSPEQLELYAGLGFMPKILRSEDGQDWYACQSQFSEDKIKIMFDALGVVRSVVDKPVPERGNVLAVSMFFPIGMSVAEIDGPLPEGFSINGDWVFNGEHIEARTFSDEEYAAQVLAKKESLIAHANKVTQAWQTQLMLGMISDDDKIALIAWMEYVKKVQAIAGAKVQDIDWPVPPPLTA